MNQLAFPGLGTIMAHRRIGYGQATIMLIGFTLTMGFMLWYLACAARFLISSAGDEKAFAAEWRSFLWAGKVGLGLCVVAWCWALVSSIGIIRQTRVIPPVLPSS